ncbi:MAG: sulfite exporter TauE/SafE family protein [Dehalococcoidia bacterium]
MDAHFSVSGVDAPLWLPPLVAFAISIFTSMAGVSGAFLILPFQMSVLGFTSPAVSPTNMVFNVFAIPSGVYRYLREGRMLWPLTGLVIAGTMPGVIAGGFIRLAYLPDPKPFKLFVAVVLLYIGARMFSDFLKTKKQSKVLAAKPKMTTAQWSAKTLSFSLHYYSFEFQGKAYKCRTEGIFILSLIVGMIGGIYGIGGGAIIAPFFVAIYRLPVYTVAGATLMGTFVTSIVGVVFYELISPLYETSEMAVSPDWALGALFGLGGMVGTYFGARTQRFIPAKWLKMMLGFVLLFVALGYVVEYFC